MIISDNSYKEFQSSLYNHIMISINPNKIEFSNPNIVKIFNKFSNNKAFLVSCENILETFCKNTDDFIQQYTTDQQYDHQTNTILLQLQHLEQKNDEFKSLIQTSISSIADDVLSKVSSQLTTLILSIDSIISSSVDKLNTNHITQNLKQIITDSLNDSSTKSKYELEEHIKKNILQPITDTQNKLLDQLGKLPELISKNDNSQEIFDKLLTTNEKWTSALENIIVDIKQLDVNVEHYIKFSNDSYNNTPLIIKGTLGDLVHNLEQQTSNISYIINSIQKDIHSNSTNIALIKSNNDDLKIKLDSLDKQLLAKTVKENNNSSIKGSIHEGKLYSLLSETLKTRDGFTVTRVNGIAHSCDLLIQKTDSPNIRIDNKAYGELNSRKVTTDEVNKFERDLLELNEHGICVSQFSDIVGKGSIEIKQLPNYKFAIYLANVNYNIPFIVDMLYLIYKLDAFTASNTSDSHISLTPDKIILIQNIIKDLTSKINSIKSTLKDTITQLNSLTFDSIELLLIDPIKQPPIPIQCEFCGFIPKNHTGLVAHQRKCNKTTKTKTINIESFLEN